MRKWSALPDLQLQTITLQPQRLKPHSWRSFPVGLSLSDVWAQRQKAAALQTQAQGQGYSLDVREDLAAFTGPPEEPEAGVTTSPRRRETEDFWNKQKADRTRSHQQASSSGRQPADRTTTRLQPVQKPAPKQSAAPRRTASDSMTAIPAAVSKRELFRRSARGPAKAAQQPDTQVSTDLHAELRSLLSDMDELDMMGMDDEMAEDASSYLAAAPKPQQQTKQQLLQLQQQAARPSTSKAVVAGLPRTASAPQPPAAAAAAAPLQIAPARPERIQLQSEHEEPQQPLAQSQTSNVRAERTEPEASPAAAQSLPAASAEAEPRAHAGAQQAASPAPTGTAAVTDEWDVFWDGPQATPGTPAPAPAAADVQPTQRPAFAADWAPLAFGESPANMGPATRDDNHEEPVRQKKPRQAKPRPGSDVPSFIIVADAPPAPSPSQAPSPRSASIAGAARTPSEQSKPGWQSTLLDQLYKAPAEPTAAPPPAALRSDAALQVPETPAPAAPAAAQQAPVSMPQQPARLDPPSPAAAAAVRSPPAANTHSDDPHTAREQSLGDQGTSPAKIRQLRPRRSASARDAGPLQSAAGAAVAPPGAAPSEDTLSRFGLSAVPDQATSPHLAMGQYDEDLDDDEDYEDEDLDDEAFWEGGKAGRQTRKSTVREVPAGSELDFFSPSTFKGLGASEELQAALQSLSIKTPSHVQAAAFKAMLFGRTSLLVADHAGSGKTLAYLAPLIQRLRHQETSDEGFAPETKDAPRALVLTPTAELCQQVLSVARGLAQAAPVRSCAITGDRKWTPQKQALAGGVDLVVGTPGRVLSHVQAGTISLRNCHTVVIDEVDVLLGDQHAFAAQTRALQQAVQPGTRFVMVTATLPEPVWLDMQALFPDIRMAKGPRLHMRPPTLVERVVDCSGGDEISEESGFLRKAESLVTLLAQEKRPRTLIFCNKILTCRKVENYLKRNAAKTGPAEAPVSVLPCHSAIEDGARTANLKAFLTAQDQTPMALVCTDRASRGLDSSCCSHVVLFDFPRDPSEYMRRAGRTARGASEGGLVSILVLGRQLKLARQIVRRNSRELPIHKLPTLPE